MDDPYHRDDPFEQDTAVKAESDAVFGQENTGINFDAYEDIPVEASGRECPPHVDTFDQLDLGAILMSNIQRCKYTKPTPVQRYAIPIGLANRDIMACAQTGSGKTAAFCFPIISGLIKQGYQPTGRQRKAVPAALILAPTRELTSQIFEEARKFSYQSGIRPVVIYGGAPVVNQVGGWRVRGLGGKAAGGWQQWRLCSSSSASVGLNHCEQSCTTADEAVPSSMNWLDTLHHRRRSSACKWLSPRASPGVLLPRPHSTRTPCPPLTTAPILLCSRTLPPTNQHSCVRWSAAVTSWWPPPAA